MCVPIALNGVLEYKTSDCFINSRPNNIYLVSVRFRFSFLISHLSFLSGVHFFLFLSLYFSLSLYILIILYDIVAVFGACGFSKITSKITQIRRLSRSFMQKNLSSWYIA